MLDNAKSKEGRICVIPQYLNVPTNFQVCAVRFCTKKEARRYRVLITKGLLLLGKALVNFKKKGIVDSLDLLKTCRSVSKPEHSASQSVASS